MPESATCQAVEPLLLRSAALPTRTLFREPADEPLDLAAILAGLADQPMFREALALASPELAERLVLWRAGQLQEGARRRVELALLRYATRMCSRATPFGLFAAVSPGRWGAASCLGLDAWGQGRKAVRLDWGLLEDMVTLLEREPLVRTDLGLLPNTTLQPWGGWYRFLEQRVAPEGEGRSYHLEAVEASPHLEAALAGAQDGQPMETQAVRLAQHLGVTLDEASDFLGQLLQAQVLVSDLHPPVTTSDPLGWVRQALPGHPALQSSVQHLDLVADHLKALERAPLGEHPEGYRRLAQPLAELGCALSGRDVVQVDLFRDARCLALGPGVQGALAAGADLLRRLTWTTPRRQAMERFKAAFLERYGSRWVPLLKVLDEESGLGFDGGVPVDDPLLEGIPIPGDTVEGVLTLRDRFLLERVAGWRGTGTWILDPNDLAGLSRPDPAPFPDSFAALASLSASDERALDRGDFTFWMEAYTGPTAARYLGRFAAGDPALAEGLRQLLAEEEARRPQAVFAEVVHLPEGRTGNVVARPALRRYEIPCLGTPSLPRDQQILPSELLVTVQGGHIRLASRRLEREVVPRLSTAHNFARGPAVYRFLAQLQDQDGLPGGWSWGALSGLPFLPRVQVGRHVLSKARWRIQARELEAAQAHAGDNPSATFAQLRQDRQLPRHVVLTDADNTLLVDLEQPMMADGLHHLVARRTGFILTECFPEPHLSPVHAPEGRLVHELVIPFRATSPAKALPRIPPLAPEPRPRAFPPGSEWLYLKLYSGPSTADRLLVDLAPLLRETQAEGLWDRWHFIRYRDPDHHLRLRFHGSAESLTGGLLPRLRDHLAASLEEELLQRWQVDTFEPEYARYGGESGFALVERWFWDDSQELLASLEAGMEPDLRWRGGLAAVDAIWATLGLTVPERLALANRTLASFRHEFRDQGAAAVAIGHRFRKVRSELPAIQPEAASSGYPACYRALEPLRGALERGELPVERDSLAGSLAHMHLNRRFRNHAREQEWVLMEFLARCYETELARGRRVR